jgi:hypothetical protein
MKRSLRDAVEECQEVIDSNPEMNETNTGSAILEPLLRELGWGIKPPHVVKEYPVWDGSGTKRVDYALQIDGEPRVFVELKRLQNSIQSAEDQLKRYMHREGVDIGVATNGQRFRIYIRVFDDSPGPVIEPVHEFSLERLIKDGSPVERIRKKTVSNNNCESGLRRDLRNRSIADDFEVKKEALQENIIASVEDELGNEKTTIYHDEIERAFKRIGKQLRGEPVTPEAQPASHTSTEPVEQSSAGDDQNIESLEVPDWADDSGGDEKEVSECPPEVRTPDDTTHPVSGLSFEETESESVVKTKLPEAPPDEEENPLLGDIESIIPEIQMDIKQLPRYLSDDSYPSRLGVKLGTGVMECDECGETHPWEEPLERGLGLVHDGTMGNPNHEPCSSEDNAIVDCECCGCPYCHGRRIYKRGLIEHEDPYQCANSDCKGEFSHPIDRAVTPDDDRRRLYWKCKYCDEATLAPFTGIPSLTNTETDHELEGGETVVEEKSGIKQTEPLALPAPDRDHSATESDPSDESEMVLQVPEPRSSDNAEWPEKNSLVTDVDTEQCQLSIEELRFMRTVVKGMNQELEGYHLMESMSRFKTQYDIDEQKLIKSGLLKLHHGSRNRIYYTITTAGQEACGLRQKHKSGEGAINDDTPHRVGIAIAQKYYGKLPVSGEVEVIAGDTDHKNDLVLNDRQDTQIAVIEVSAGRTSRDANVSENDMPGTNCYESVQDDYQSLANSPGQSVWVVRNHEIAGNVLRALSNGDDIPFTLPRDVIKKVPDGEIKMEGLNENHIKPLEDEGITEIVTYTSLRNYLRKAD